MCYGVKLSGGMKNSRSYGMRNGGLLQLLLTYDAKIELSVAIFSSMYALSLFFFAIACGSGTNCPPLFTWRLIFLPPHCHHT